MDRMKKNGQSDGKLRGLKLIARNKCYLHNFETGRTEELKYRETVGEKRSNRQQQGGNLKSGLANNVAKERIASQIC